MGKIFHKITLAAAVITMLSGCVIVINNSKPTADEQNLIDIQTQANQQVAQVTQKIQTGGYSITQIQALITEAKKSVDENLKKIDALKIPERTKALAETTKNYLKKAAETYITLLQMSAQTGVQISAFINNLQTVSQPLANMAKQAEDVKNQFLNELQKAANSQ